MTSCMCDDGKRRESKLCVCVDLLMLFQGPGALFG